MIPIHLYKPLIEKIIIGDLLKEAASLLDSKELRVIDKFEQLPFLRSVLLSQEVIKDLELSDLHCKYQSNTSKGIVKQCKVLFLDEKVLRGVVIESDGVKMRMSLISLFIDKYSMLGNIIYKKKV